MLVDTFAHRLSIAIKLRNIKQSELAEMTGIDKSLISNYIAGKYQAKQNNVYLLAKALNVNESWLMGYDVPIESKKDLSSIVYVGGEVPMPKKEVLESIYKAIINKNEASDSAVVLVYGTIPAGVPMECIEDILDTEEIPASWLNGDKQFFGLKIKGDSMFPEYHDGDTLILEKVEDCESGQDAVVMVNGNDGTFKRVIKNENGIILQPLNPKFPPMVYSNEQIENLPIKIIGVAKEIRRKI